MVGVNRRARLTHTHHGYQALCRSHNLVESLGQLLGQFGALTLESNRDFSEPLSQSSRRLRGNLVRILTRTTLRLVGSNDLAAVEELSTPDTARFLTRQRLTEASSLERALLTERLGTIGAGLVFGEPQVGVVCAARH